MKPRFSRIILSALILSLALQTIALPVYAQSESNQSQAEFEVPVTLPENRLISYPDHREAQPDPEDLFESSERREAIPPSPEIIAETQAQVNAFNCASVTEVPQVECQALVALYGSTNGGGWTDNTNWLQSTSVSTWHGVTVGTGRVIYLGLNVNKLNGSIPSDLGNLSNLMALDLYGNELTGGIPAELGSLSNLLELSLDSNQLTGSIPSTLGNLSNLWFLSLKYNLLTGSIPSSLGNLSNLEDLILNNNQLTGSLPLSFVKLAKLEFFNFDDTNLCEPETEEFLNWKATVDYWFGTGVICKQICLPLIFR